MRIEPGKIENVYEIQLKNDAGSSGENKGREIQKDRIELSSECKSYDEQTSVSKSITSEIESGAGTEKLRKLKAQIQSGTYNVSGEAIAEAMLSYGGKNQ